MGEAVQCPYLFVSRAVTNHTDIYFRVGTAVSVICNDGYELEGEPIVFCLPSGEWSESPTCESITTGGSGVDSTLIVVICSIASIIALGVLIFSAYMLCGNVKTENEVKEQQKEQKEIEDMQNLRIYQAVTQDCVGMPAVVYSNINATLRGRPTSSSDGSNSSSSPEPNTTTQLELDDSKAFIY